MKFQPRRGGSKNVFASKAYPSFPFDVFSFHPSGVQMYLNRTFRLPRVSLCSTLGLVAATPFGGSYKRERIRMYIIGDGLYIRMSPCIPSYLFPLTNTAYRTPRRGVKRSGTLGNRLRHLNGIEPQRGESKNVFASEGHKPLFHAPPKPFAQKTLPLRYFYKHSISSYFMEHSLFLYNTLSRQKELSGSRFILVT